MLVSEETQEKTLFGLPEKVEFCTKCVISNQRPSSSVEFKSTASQAKEVINFQDGVCSACRYNETKDREIDWDAREEALIQLLDKYRSNDGSYDVIVPGSGGKDSAYVSHILKDKYGMHPLTVTWAPHLYTDIGFKNFENWIHVGGLDNILFTPNGVLHRLLTRLAFVNLLHPFQPFIIGQRIIGARFAQKFNVKLVFYGENPAEYGNNISENKSPTMKKQFYSTPSATDIHLGGVSMQKIMDEYGFSLADFLPYIPLSNEENSQDIDYQYLGYYKKWDPQECFYYAVQNTGFQPNPERTEGSYSRYSSLDDKIDPFHYYTTYIKFGLGRASYDAAQEIRTNKITREEGVNLVRKYDSEFPAKYFHEFLEYINLSEDEFFATTNKFRSPHLWLQDEVTKEFKLRNILT